MEKREGRRLLGIPRGRIILKWIIEKQDGGDVDWIHLAQERDQ
jgi:hypothetical protein